MPRPASISILTVLCALAPNLLAADAPSASDPAAVKAIQSHLDQLKDVRTLQLRFVCQKNLAQLDAPLISAGQLWIRRGEDKPGQGPAVRFSTEKPYLSELILADGKVYGRSQHETDWTTSSQSTRPGLTAIMVQLGGWATGATAKLADTYLITALPPGTRLPDSPPVSDIKPHPVNDGKPVDLFLLTPRDKDLAAAIKNIQLAMDRKTGALASIEITTQQNDITRYWFDQITPNPTLPPDTFKPTGDFPTPDQK